MTEPTDGIMLNMILLGSNSLADAISEISGFEYVSESNSTAVSCTSNSTSSPANAPYVDLDSEDSNAHSSTGLSSGLGCEHAVSDPEGEDQGNESDPGINQLNLNDFIGVEYNENGEPITTYVSHAKDIFGYPETLFSDFMLHHKVKPGWWPSSIDNVISMVAQFALNHDTPYPGDGDCWGAETSYRFVVNKLNESTYYITDCEAESIYGELQIPKELLLQPKFKLGAWYAKKCAMLLNLPFDHKAWDKAREIGNVFADGMKFVLTCGIPAYPKGLGLQGTFEPHEHL
ncbi:hypothetical protein GYMLUDRAFT_246952 [Collybiopsis luxurians FD-317 M1]|uniref:Uncharacterized protein n=1 Tax=Collybiopsis luxurians FD-317 M1 TaxID=944289 RepID=A0A0D0BQY8_9AGAR|nr:hypothetical protein GYMLUDRAFT_246952 [Collybiopsis luxurians FD-317 M1]